MSWIEDLKALQTRVEAATSDDGTLLVDAAAILIEEEPTADDEAGRTTPADDRFRRLIGAEGWIEAALCLVERVRPGWGVSVAITSDDGMAQVALLPPLYSIRPAYYHSDRPGGSRAMALLAALIASHFPWR